MKRSLWTWPTGGRAGAAIVLGGVILGAGIYSIRGVRSPTAASGAWRENLAKQQLLPRQPLPSMNGQRTDAEGAAAKTVSLSPEEREQKRKQSIKDRAGRFQAAFENEAVEEPWSSTYEGTVTKFFRDHETSGNTLESVSCHKTFCRVVIQHADRSARQEFSESLGSEPFTGGSFYHPADGGSMRSIAYLGRPGMKFKLPTEGKSDVTMVSVKSGESEDVQ